MMNEIIISVIIPVYNVERYLQSCIDACLAQTQTGIEYIFINDASTDGSLSILRKNEKLNSSIKVIDSPRNLRQGGARNLGISVAKGEYIGFVDSDDLPLPRMYELLYSKAQETNADLCFIHSARINENITYANVLSDKLILGNPDNVWTEKTLKMENRVLSDKDKEWLLVKSPGHIWNGLWKRNLLDRANVLFPEYLSYEDNFWGAIVEAYVDRIAFVEEVGYLYRVNPNSTTQARNQKVFYDRITIKNLLYETAKERHLLAKLRDAYEFLYVYRDTFTTYQILVTKYDQPDYMAISSLIKELKQTFPNWDRNPYIRKLLPLKTRIEEQMICLTPKGFARLLHFYTRHKK